ncbi:MAG: hypothetical protein DRJ03_17385 [Chloroflexi bacterium]|nr:MAG: hypothetical protein DRJ03_17385 [Chloroflexota bacterium]
MDKATVFAISAYTILITIAIALPLNYYFATIYPMDRAKAYLSAALSTTNLYEVANYTRKALGELAPYHGNPCWIAPTVRTDIDDIKKCLEEIITTCVECARATHPGTDAYQEALDTARNRIHEVMSRIDNVILWLWYQPLNITLGIAWCLVAFLIVPYIWHKLSWW